MKLPILYYQQLEVCLKILVQEDTKILKGRKGYRIRVGNYRVVYELYAILLKSRIIKESLKTKITLNRK